MQPTAEAKEIETVRRWLIDHKVGTSFSWSELSKRTGIATGTISQFGSEKGYRGDEGKVAAQVDRYRQSLVAVSRVDAEMPTRPGFFETTTSGHITNILKIARMGRVVAVATGAGLGKSESARNFRDCYPNVYLITLHPALYSIAQVLGAILKQLGEPRYKGAPDMLFEQICEVLNQRHKPVLIFDEVQHASVKTIDQCRAINDETGAGIALFGNIPVLRKIEGGGRDEAFAQIYSRLAHRLVRGLPLRADAEAQAAAWGIEDPALIDMIVRIAATPGGLRNVTHALELAIMFAQGENEQLNLNFLQNAWAQISGRGEL
jgi:DNA transposition AAA+ family ATPase